VGKGKKNRYVKEGDLFIGRWNDFGMVLLHDFMVKYFDCQFIETHHRSRKQVEARSIFFFLCLRYFPHMSTNKIAHYWMWEHQSVSRVVSEMGNKFNKSEMFREECDLIMYRAFFIEKENVNEYLESKRYE